MNNVLLFTLSIIGYILTGILFAADNAPKYVKEHKENRFKFRWFIFILFMLFYPIILIITTCALFIENTEETFNKEYDEEEGYDDDSD